MGDEYREVLRKWAAQRLADPGQAQRPDVKRITDVKVNFSEGCRWSSWTEEPADFTVEIHYLDQWDHEKATTIYSDADTSVSSLLSDLFKIAELGADDLGLEPPTEPEPPGIREAAWFSGDERIGEWVLVQGGGIPMPVPSDFTGVISSLCIRHANGFIEQWPASELKRL